MSIKNQDTVINEFGQTIGLAVPNWQTRPRPTKTSLIGQYCTLLPLDPELHATELFAAFRLNNKGDSWTYLPYGPFETLEPFKAWLTEAASKNFFYTIIDHSQNSAQGVASYFVINPEHGSIEVGAIHYSKALQRSRIATEVMYLMMQNAFDALGYRRYEWRCNALNLPSRAAAERLGFKFEGIFRQMYVFKGHNRDTAWYSIIDSEWPNLKIKFQKWLAPSNFDAQGQQKKKLREL